MKSVGIVGIENSHATEIVRFLNVEAPDVPVRITALVAGEPERTRELAALGASNASSTTRARSSARWMRSS